MVLVGRLSAVRWPWQQPSSLLVASLLLFPPSVSLPLPSLYLSLITLAEDQGISEALAGYSRPLHLRTSPFLSSSLSFFLVLILPVFSIERLNCSSWLPVWFGTPRTIRFKLVWRTMFSCLSLWLIQGDLWHCSFGLNFVQEPWLLGLWYVSCKECCICLISIYIFTELSIWIPFFLLCTLCDLSIHLSTIITGNLGGPSLPLVPFHLVLDSTSFFPFSLCSSGHAKHVC